MPKPDSSHGMEASAYVAANAHRLPVSLPYVQGKYRTYDSYAISTEHRKHCRIADAATNGKLDQPGQWTRADLDAAYRADLLATIGSRFEWWTRRTYAEALYALDDRPGWLAQCRAAIKCSTQNNPAEDVIDEMLAQGIDDPYAEAGL